MMPPRTHNTTAFQLEFERARAQTDLLFGLLRPGAIYGRPVPERHRLIFYLGHLDAFDWNLVGVRHLGLPSLHRTFDKLFEFGIDPGATDLPDDRASDWPSVEEVLSYTQCAREKVDALTGAATEDVLRMCIEHRLMHAETLCYLIHNLHYELKKKLDTLPWTPGELKANRPIAVPGGIAILGKPRDGRFGWDNEYNVHHVPVPEFEIDSHKVTNLDYLQFVNEGGPVPHFWTRREDRWFYRGMFADIPLPSDHPVYVTWDQASAYAKWKNKSLPTEAQFHRSAYGDGSAFPWGNALPSSEHGNFGFRHWDPVPVNAYPAGETPSGIAQLTGNGWEWTSSPFAPFPGFEAHPDYPGYSADFFGGEHYVLKGASARTALPLLRRSFRNWFRPNYAYAYTGFRCVNTK